MPLDPIAEILRRHAVGESFRPQEVTLDTDRIQQFVRFRMEPPRFAPVIFDGDWAVGSAHPEPGPIRILRVITDRDGVTRVVGRQGAYVYASPWIA